MKASHQLIDISHLRRPLRADKRADDNFTQTSFGQRIEQLYLGSDWNIRALDLQAVSHAFFSMNNFRIAAHAVLLFG